MLVREIRMNYFVLTKRRMTVFSKTRSFLALILVFSIFSISQTVFSQTIKIQHPIFDDNLRNDWEDSSEKSITNPKYDEWILNGAYAFSATLEKGGALIFKREIPLSTKNYTGIAGYINGGSSGKQLIGVCVIDHTGKRLPNDIGLDLRKYVQGGSLPVEDWKVFVIPFNHFGSLQRGIKGICFVNASNENAEPFYLDDFGLVDFPITAKKATTPINVVKPKPKQQSTLIFADKFENGWQNWSWQCEAKEYSGSSASGKVSLFVGQEFNAGLAFATQKPFLVREYTAIEFSLNGGTKSDQQKLRVALFDKGGNEIKGSSVDLNNKDFIEGGSLAINQWKKVTIPFSSMNAGDTPVKKIGIINSSSEMQAFLIDDVMLVK
jgi:hypothetical protein